MKNFISFLFVALLWPSLANAGDGVGTVKELAGTAKITHVAAKLAAQEMKMGDVLFEDDIIETDEGARAVLHFSDEAELVITGKGKVVVEEFIYAPEKDGGNKILLEILGSAFSYAGGMVDKDKKGDVKLKLDYGALGIRGTKVFGVLRSGLDWIYLEEGAATVENAGGKVDLQPGFGTRMIGKNEAPSPAYMWGEAEIGWIRRLVDDPAAHETQAMASNMRGGKVKRPEAVEEAQEAGPVGGGAPAIAPDEAGAEKEAAPSRAREAAAPAPAAPPAPKQKAVAPQDESRIDTTQPATIKLAEFDLAAEKLQDTMLVYSAELKALEISSAAYLEMGVRVGGWVSSRSDSQLTTAGDWRKFATTAFLKKGQIPDKVVLNLVFTGKGSVLVRNIKLER